MYISPLHVKQTLTDLPCDYLTSFTFFNDLLVVIYVCPVKRYKIHVLRVPYDLLLFAYSSIVKLAYYSFDGLQFTAQLLFRNII